MEGIFNQGTRLVGFGPPRLRKEVWVARKLVGKRGKVMGRILPKGLTGEGLILVVV